MKSFRGIKEDELRILKFSDPYAFFGLAFWSLFVQRRNKNIFCGPAFGASRFFILWLRFWGLGLFRAPRCFDPALKQGTKKTFGATSFKFWGLTFLGTLGPLGPRAETGKKNKTFGAPFSGASLLNLIWGIGFSEGLGLFGAPTGTLFGPPAETGNKKIGKNRRE